jgi:protein involved in polysaccharide export with SLBB domain
MVTIAAAAAPLAGQQGSGPSAGRYVTRDDLKALIARLDSAVRSPAYSEGLKARAQAQAAEARSRLADGDFRVGDRLLLTVQGESALTDTFTVGQGSQLLLPLVGPIPLRGVLHAELESYLTAQLVRRIRDPRVEARPMVRVAIEGAVVRPGFYSVPVGALLGDAVMVAGGLVTTARAEDSRVERSGRNVLSSAAFRQAMTAGRTLDQLDVRAGDRIVVPERGGGPGVAETRLRVVTTLLSIPLTVFALTQLF